MIVFAWIFPIFVTLSPGGFERIAAASSEGFDDSETGFLCLSARLMTSAKPYSTTCKKSR